MDPTPSGVGTVQAAPPDPAFPNGGGLAGDLDRALWGLCRSSGHVLREVLLGCRRILSDWQRFSLDCAGRTRGPADLRGGAVSRVWPVAAAYPRWAQLHGSSRRSRSGRSLLRLPLYGVASLLLAAGLGRLIERPGHSLGHATRAWTV